MLQADAPVSTPSPLAPATKDFLAGAVGGCASVLAGQPLDTIRIRLQHGAFGDFGQTCRSLVASGGIKCLFKGAAYPLLTITLQSAVVFQSFGIACRAINRDQAVLPYEQVCMAGMFSGAVQTAISTPVDLLKIRQQLQVARSGMASYVGPLQLLRQILKTEGLPGLYRGGCITLLRDIPAHAIYFTSYELCHELFEPGSRLTGTHSPAALFVSGGIAGALSWLGIYHFDVVKTRLQSLPASVSPYKGCWSCARHIYAAEGARAFARGLGTTLCRAFIVNAVLFSGYETALQALSGHDPANAA
ncbi:g12999 [Coccomyxa viridis]|uniref:G12999 protein n=1 Tax=Coccomyxa viridis TaxID=1274662 RepID=A0ABP1GEC4_9CHLO